MATSSVSSHPDREEGAAAAACCMCGDQGLPRELFRCKSCRVRLQHSYCSNLYPRATAYTRCNWCLVSEPSPLPPVAQVRGVAIHATSTSSSSSTKRKSGTTSTASDEEGRKRCSSRRPPAELGSCPVKKKCKAAESVPEDAGMEAGSRDEAGESKERMRAGEARRVRVKVQRYRLLAELISC